MDTQAAQWDIVVFAQLNGEIETESVPDTFAPVADGSENKTKGSGQHDKCS